VFVFIATSFGGDMQTPSFPLRAGVVPLVTIGGNVLIVNALPRRSVNLVELEGPGRGNRGVNFNRETDQRERDLSGPIRACHQLPSMQNQALRAAELGVFKPVW
jgi:hypothetical protein